MQLAIDRTYGSPGSHMIRCMPPSTTTTKWILCGRAWICILSSSIQVDISRVSAANEWEIDLNTRRLKFLSTSEHVIFSAVYYIDIDEIPGQQFLWLITYALSCHFLLFNKKIIVFACSYCGIECACVHAILGISAGLASLHIASLRFANIIFY